MRKLLKSAGHYWQQLKNPVDTEIQPHDSVAGAPAQADPSWRLFTAWQRWGFLAILSLVSTSNFMDRMVVSVLLEPIKLEFGLSDTMLGLLSGFSFAVFYAIAGIPMARWADRGDRRTVITVALAAWSVMTMLCGLAQTFWQLLLARVGVGIGEAGGIPPSQSLIVDYFPPAQRTTAIAVFQISASFGYAVGLVGGGYLAATYGWRSAFLVMGVPGLLLAIATRFVLKEPRKHRGFIIASATLESVTATVSTLWRKRSFAFALSGFVLHAFVNFGALAFVPSFMVRVLDAPLAQATSVLGLVAMVGIIIGTLGGGALADWLGRRDIRWLARLPAISFALSGPLHMLAFSANDFWSFIGLNFAAVLLMSLGGPASYAAIHAICGSRRRAMAIAIVLFATTFLGMGLGPLATGALSDMLNAAHGVDSLRYALMIAVMMLIPAGGFFYLSGRAMPIDQET